jgi:hypothetical protein
MRHLTLNRVFVCYVLFFVLLVGGIVPRGSVLVVAVLLAVWMALVPLETAVLFFIRAIPLFVALPLTAAYDNLNLWRPLSLLLAGRMLWEPSTRQVLQSSLRAFFRAPNTWLKDHPVIRRSAILCVLACLSLIGAAYPVTGLIRIIYFVNLSMVPVIVWALLRQHRITASQVIRSIAIPTMIVIVAGAAQVVSTYLMDVYQFMQLWGEGIQLRQFGAQWSHIAVSVGNTWLAYYGEQLSLRVFSLFPDSHSFPTFVLLGIPALLALSIDPIIRIASDRRWGVLVRTYAQWSVLWVPAAFLAAILSGTRGIWAASVGVVLLVPLWAWLMRRNAVSIARRRLFLYGASFLAAFFLLFSLAWPIFISPQFLVGKGDYGLLSNRIRSVIDLGETSNALRLAIWKSSLSSIARHPLLGVGIGTFPVVLDQNIMLARAGSTAHNLYLHVAAETGVIAALEATVLLVSSVAAAYRWFARAQGRELVYAGSLLLYLPWVYAYVLTDPILFDERVFLLWAATLALVWSHDDA